MRACRLSGMQTARPGGSSLACVHGFTGKRRLQKSVHAGANQPSVGAGPLPGRPVQSRAAAPQHTKLWQHQHQHASLALPSRALSEDDLGLGDGWGIEVASPSSAPSGSATRGPAKKLKAKPGASDPPPRSHPGRRVHYQQQPRLSPIGRQPSDVVQPGWVHSFEA